MDSAILLPKLLAAAWLIPLASFTLIVLFGPRMGQAGRLAGVLATAAILTSAVLSQFALWAVWLPQHHWGRPGMGESPAAGNHSQWQPEGGPAIKLVSAAKEEHAAKDEHAGSAAPDHAAAEHGAHAEHGEHDEHAPAQVYPPAYYAGDWYVLGQFGKLRITIGYYIDALTVLMFAMVTFIATCIHFYANGYMHDELHEIVDHEVTVHGHHLHRPGRFHRFFQYLSLFCFSMLGIVIAGNIAMVFVFWELVGICSYFLIGFYIERHSASTAANKAFIVNRVGDFGMIIGLMALFGSLGTFAFGDYQDEEGKLQPGLFSLVRPEANHWKLTVPDGMLAAAGKREVARIIHEHMTPGAIDEAGADANPAPGKATADQQALAAEGLAAGKSEAAARLDEWRQDWTVEGVEGSYGRAAYWLLVIAGLGIFCGCVGKSAQFPLHVWLPDAMEGPTPVSALVHSATMVAAGVYLVGRFYPVFAPETLLVIALVGCITLFLAATIAITATDIKRVLAYSTVSQLGYMMLALGAGGWVAGLFHLITHAFFKSLLFLCSGSVIHAVHTNEMPLMGGLRHKMPWTAYTMLIGCMAIAGAGIPFVIGFSGYYSKDSIIAQTLAFRAANPMWGFPFYAASISAAITSFYMFRLWYMTFAGKPRDHHKYDHAHESPKVMVYPLAVLAALAIGVGWQIGPVGVENLLEQARPAGTGQGEIGALLTDLRYPSEYSAHHFHQLATIVASTMALSGFVLATLFYGLKILDPADVQRQFVPVFRLLLHKWYFDELYNAVFIQPCHFVARRVADFDKQVIDEIIHFLARATVWISRLDDLIDRYLVDGLVNWFARWTYAVALALKVAQTGQLRQYILFIVVGTVGLFVLISYALAG